jgi:hypothetical protein
VDKRALCGTHTAYRPSTILISFLCLSWLAGCSAGTPDAGAVAEPTATVTVTVTVTDVVKPTTRTTSTPAEPTHSTDAPTTPADGTGDGSRTNPLQPGTAVDVGDWSVVLGVTIQNADDLVAEENQFNDPPVDGRQFVMAPLAATYQGTKSGTAWIELGFKFLGSAGNTFGSSSDDSCGLIPGDLLDQGEAYPGATVEGNVCVSVPTDQIVGGAWIIEDDTNFRGQPVFVRLS